jgi:hypothetical protein
MPKDVVAWPIFATFYKHNSLICRVLMDQEEQLSEVLTDKNVRT